MGTSKEQKRRAKNQQKLKKRNATKSRRADSTQGTKVGLFKFTQNWKGGSSGAYEFPGMFRDIVCRCLPDSLEASTDLTDVQIELVWYESIQDRALGQNPFVTLVGTLKTASFLTSRTECPDLVKKKEYQYWKLQLELVEIIEKGSLYGEWHKRQGDGLNGFQTEELELVLGILSESMRKLRFEGKMPTLSENKTDTLWVRDCVFFENSRKKIDEISPIQVDALLFFIKALGVVIPALSSSKPPFLESELKVKTRIRELNSAEEKCISQHRLIVSEIRALKCQIDSLIEINFQGDRKVKEYHNVARQIDALKKECLITQNTIENLEKSKVDLESQLAKLKKSLREATTKKLTDEFKKLTLKKHEIEETLRSTQAQIEQLKLKLRIDKSDILKKESRGRLLESELQISDLLSSLRELREREIALMTNLDRIFVERIIALLPYNIWAKRHNKATVEA